MYIPQVNLVGGAVHDEVDNDLCKVGVLIVVALADATG